jgi:hypothetical protein
VAQDIETPYFAAPRDFTLGPPAAHAPRPRNRLLVVAVATVVAGAGVWFAAGGSGGKADVKSTPAPRPPVSERLLLTKDPDVLLSTLRNAATAEESYAADSGRYTGNVADLNAQGLSPDPRVKVTVVSAAGRHYCLEAAGAGALARWYDSATGRTSATACH